MINSKNKGSRSELKICEMLTNKLTYKFSRIPTSGAFGTTHKLSVEAKMSYSGDIFCGEKPDFIFSVENKAGYNLEIINFISPKSNPDKKTIKEFCEQASRDALCVPGRVPILIYTKDRKIPICAVPLKNNSREKEIQDLFKKKEMQHFYLYFEDFEYKEWQEWALFPFQEFLDSFDKEFFFGLGDQRSEKTD